MLSFVPVFSYIIPLNGTAEHSLGLPVKLDFIFHLTILSYGTLTAQPGNCSLIKYRKFVSHEPGLATGSGFVEAGAHVFSENA